MDPLVAAMRPPPNETAEQTAARKRREQEAKAVSDQIDAAIAREKENMRRRKVIRLLLLGQSESGKSTTLKQFQIMHSTNAFQGERLSWRLVIQLNLVKSIRRILDLVINAPPLPSPSTSLTTPYPEERWDTSASGVAYPRTSTDSLSSGWTGTASTSSTNDFPAYRLKLIPLLRAERILSDKLASPDTPHYRGDAIGGRQGITNISWADSPAGAPEIFVRSGDLWKMKNPIVGDEQLDEAARVIADAREDMMALWANPTVHEILKEARVNLSESSGFFLDDLERIATVDYVPTNDDILHARLKTVGVVEHSFSVNQGGRSVDWRIYDVGGARSQRIAWAPFFDNVEAIIFLAPLSVFDQALVEDPTENRLEDSLTMWRELCKHPMLSKVPLVLFMNKTDLLRKKLESGVRLATFMISYDQRRNDYDTVLKYFKDKFNVLRKQYSKDPEREFYVYATAVTDLNTTPSIINSVRDLILREDLRRTNLI